MTTNLKIHSKKLRKLIFEIGLKNSGHISTSLSCVELLITIFFGGHVRINKKNCNSIKRNNFILSKGHADTAMYSLLFMLNMINKNVLYNKYNSGKNILGCHVDHKIPGIDLTTGSLGHGLGFACGIALSNKINKYKFKNFVLLGDAECTEGSIWEAALFASFHKLKNLIVFIDRNRIGSLQYTHDFTSLEPLDKKWLSFGWNVQEINGHSHSQIQRSINNSYASNKPNVIIANTVKGKGIKIMENDPVWHVKKLTQDIEIQKARKDLGI